MRVQVVENVLKLNDEIAQLNRQQLNAADVYCLDLIGAPGSGKTALVEATIDALRPNLRVGVIVGDLATQRDAERLARHTDQVVQINTGKGCHLDANQVRQGLARLDLSQIDLLVIENVGNLICPVGFDLGQHAKVGLFSFTEGDDKAAKHPYLVQEAAILLLNKLDLKAQVSFDLSLFQADVARLNPRVPLLQLSARCGQGLPAWIDWLQAQRASAKRS